MRSLTFRFYRTFIAGIVALAPLSAAQAGAPSCVPAGGLDRVTRALNGQPNDRSVLPAISADGCVIAFKSYASNLVDNDTNDKVDVFAFDRSADSTERIPVQPATGSSGNPRDNSFPPALNGDGSIVAFASLSNNLTPGDVNTDADVFVYDRGSQVTSILTLREDGELGGGAPDLPPSLSADARFVAFSASSPKIVSNDFNQAYDVFVYDRETGETELISVATTGSSAGRAALLASNGGVISADGCVVAFYSDAPNVVAADRNDVRDVFVRNRCTSESERVSVASDGTEGNAASQAAGFQPGISGDGQLVVFASDATNLDEGDDNGVADVFVRNRGDGSTRRLSKAPNGESGNAASQFPAISADGRFVAFQSSASNLVDGDGNGLSDIFVIDLATDQIRRLTPNGGEPNGNSTAPQLNADGTVVVFQSDASNLVDDDSNGASDIFASTNSLSFTPTPVDTETETPTATVTETPVPPTNTPVPTSSNTPVPPSPTASHTPTLHVDTSPTHTPTSGASTPTRTPTSTVTGNGNGNGGGGGGGCSCRVDPETGQAADSTPLAASLLPLALWFIRRRRTATEIVGERE